ncbi:MAG: 50S ribosomal protein L10 [Verrucomicrobia bacterium]|jgi:large subunit ribosomal protein L10|nr:50S ribosomal protein L10 [Verrucomicrobiota bacterium]MBT7066201.1 50S ribosomal protein L10 [Verrucomicrobiota bacterium]MBT7698792.1 50S ribosomal protein L10 [Verrucomicrobiota bacterium]
MRPEKESIIAEITELVKGTGFIFLVDYRGLKVDQLAELRAKLRDLDTSMTIVKNSMLGHASAAAGGPDMSGLLEGPTAIVCGSGDASATAKALTAFIKQAKLPVLKGGQLGQQLLSVDDVKAIATIPSREVLYGQIAGTIAAPMTQLVGVMNQKVLSLLYVLKAVEDTKKEESA